MPKSIQYFIALLLLEFGSACSSNLSFAGIGSSNLEVAAVQGSLAPDFELASIEGGDVKLSDFRGEVVLVNFWATWCGPCRVEMPALQSRFEAYDGDLVILAVDNDEPLERVSAFVDELGLTFTVLLDLGANIQELFLIRGYPTSIFVDADGIIQFIHIGIMTEDQLDGYLSEMGLGEGN